MPGDQIRILVTGGAGFIGSALCRHLVRTGAHVVNADAFTHAANPDSLLEISHAPAYRCHRADIRDRAAMFEILGGEGIDLVFHLAAESHVDRSILGPAEAVDTNIVGTFSLLEAALEHWRRLPSERRERFRFCHVSTDEVFGDLPDGAAAFTERSPYAPSSPYAASKAAADHLVRAWHRTYGLPVLISNCSNNYGPFQHPEKLIPLAILNALEEQAIPVYGDGANIRDWLFVEDHVRALELMSARGRIGETYLIGGRSERSNLAVVEAICDLVDARRPLAGRISRRGLIAFVADRPGHDRRYSVDPAKTERELGWRCRESFEHGLGRTVDWYLANEPWWRPMRERQSAREPPGAAA